MKPNQSTMLVKGSLPNAGRKMDFDPDAINHIMRILIDLYGNKELAVIRELSTNARDSHVMAGRADQPIHVQTPSSLSPYLVIRDEGLGLSADEIYALFGRYGASTKRGTNDATGMLGLGSKSPLTYTNQFTMTAVKDGRRAVVAITRDEDGVGNLTVVDETDTDDHNGVEVRIPAKAGNTLEKTARGFFRYWQPGTVLLNGNDPTGLGENAMELSPQMFLLNETATRTYSYASAATRTYSDLSAESVIVMGNVPYPAPELSYAMLGIPAGYGLVAYVPIGAVDFTPSREKLQDTKRTRDAIAQIKSDFKQLLNGAVQKEINNAPTPMVALSTLKRWQTLARTISNNIAFTYKGKTIPTSVQVPTKPAKTAWGTPTQHPTQGLFLVHRYEVASRRRGARQRVPVVNFDLMLSSMFVTGYSNTSEPSVTSARKAAQWLSNQPNDVQKPVRYIVFLDWTPAALDFIDPKLVVDFSVTEAEKLPKVVNSTTSRIPGSFDVLVGGKPALPKRWMWGVPGDDIDQNNPVFWLHGNLTVGETFAAILDDFLKKYTLICLPENRIAKFKRENPKIERAADKVKELAEQSAKKMTQLELDALAQYDARDRNTFQNMTNYKGQIKDPDVVHGIELAQVSLDGILKMRERFRGKIDYKTGTWKNPMTKYPYTSGRAFIHDPDHALRYMNNEYEWLTNASKSGTLQP